MKTATLYLLITGVVSEGKTGTKILAHAVTYISCDLTTLIQE